MYWSRSVGACRNSAGAGDWEAVNHLQEKSLQLAGELFAEAITSCRSAGSH